MMSTEFCDSLTPSPSLSAQSIPLVCKFAAFPNLPRPSVRTSYMEAPILLPFLWPPLIFKFKSAAGRTRDGRGTDTHKTPPLGGNRTGFGGFSHYEKRLLRNQTLDSQVSVTLSEGRLKPKFLNTSLSSLAKYLVMTRTVNLTSNA